MFVRLNIYFVQKLYFSINYVNVLGDTIHPLTPKINISVATTLLKCIYDANLFQLRSPRRALFYPLKCLLI